jgi:uncharacterized SAM-binding protein YcdF (DUF218 family)
MIAKEITKYIFIDDKNPSGDIALVFGTWNARKESIEKASKLYKNGFVPKIIVSGGINPGTGIVEADLMAEELRGLGVMKEDIFIEDKSINTLENVIFSKEIIDRELGIKNIRVITAVVKNYHARRALMTLRKYMPGHIRLKAAAYTSAHYPFTKDNWSEVKCGKRKVAEELKKIEKYFAKGDLADL